MKRVFFIKEYQVIKVKEAYADVLGLPGYSNFHVDYNFILEDGEIVTVTMEKFKSTEDVVAGTMIAYTFDDWRIVSNDGTDEIIVQNPDQMKAIRNAIISYKGK